MKSSKDASYGISFKNLSKASSKGKDVQIDSNSTSKQNDKSKVRVAVASGLAQEFLIVLPPKVKIKNSTSSVYSILYGN